MNLMIVLNSQLRLTITCTAGNALNRPRGSFSGSFPWECQALRLGPQRRRIVSGWRPDGASTKCMAPLALWALASLVSSHCHMISWGFDVTLGPCPNQPRDESCPLAGFGGLHQSATLQPWHSTYDVHDHVMTGVSESHMWRAVDDIPCRTPWPLIVM